MSAFSGKADIDQLLLTNLDGEYVSVELCAEPGDGVEIEFSERDPTKRESFVISLDSHNPNNGVVRVDSPLGQMLL
jgi:hypothetical protein